MRLLVLPRDPNPYQSLLYGEMRRLGVHVTYIGELTPSRTLNLLLLPLEIAAARMAGARLLHVHWVFIFVLPGARRFPVLRRVAYAWFLLWLQTCRILGVHIAWTAHNVLPHEPVFADDVSARRALARASEIVFAHSSAALAELTDLGAVPRRSAIIRHGPIPAASATSLRLPGADGGPRRFLFFGRVHAYKGVEDLLAAFAALPGAVAAELTVAGQCDDPVLRSRLRALAGRCGERLTLRLEHIPEREVAQLLGGADVVVLPFRRVTTSGSAMIALSYRRPLIVPDLPGLADLPDRAVLRYDGKIPALAAAMTHLAGATHETLAEMSAAAGDYASTTTWREIAEITLTEMISVVGEPTPSGAPVRAAGSP